MRREAPHCLLQQLPIKRTTRKILKAVQSNAFKIFLGLDLSAKRCRSTFQFLNLLRFDQTEFSYFLL
jgi:hypothetical protein